MTDRCAPFQLFCDYPIYDLFDSRSSSDVLYETREAITAAARSNVNFYTIDPQGLIGLPGDAPMIGAGAFVRSELAGLPPVQAHFAAMAA